MESKIETKDKTAQNKYFLIIALSFALYVAMVASKNFYSAEIVEIIKCYDITKAAAALTMTCYYATYAVGQLVIAKILPKISILKWCFWGIVVSAFFTVAVPFCTAIWQMYVLFILNALSQSLVWPTIMYVASNYLPDSMAPKANMAFGVGYAVGFVLDYVTAAVFLKLFNNWKIGFWFFGAMLILSVAIFYRVVSKSKKQDDNKGKMSIKISTTSVNKVRSNFYVFAAVECFGCLVTAVIYYGMSNWITALFHDVYNMSSANSALISLFVPIVVTLGPILATTYCEKTAYWNVTISSMVICTAASVLLAFFYGSNVILALVLSMIALVFGRGIAHVFDTVIVMKSRKFVDVGVFAALTNFFASLGGAIGPPIIGKILDMKFENKAVPYMLSYLFIAFCAVVVILSIIIPYKKIKSYN